MSETTIWVGVIVVIVLFLFVGVGVGVYLFFTSSTTPSACACDASQSRWSDRTDAVKSDATLEAAWNKCGTGAGAMLCQQNVCLGANKCFAPVFEESGKTGPPWCFNPFTS